MVKHEGLTRGSQLLKIFMNLMPVCQDNSGLLGALPIDFGAVEATFLPAYLIVKCMHICMRASFAKSRGRGGSPELSVSLKASGRAFYFVF